MSLGCLTQQRTSTDRSVFAFSPRNPSCTSSDPEQAPTVHCPETTISHCPDLLTKQLYLYSATTFTVKCFPPRWFAKPAKSPWGWFSTERWLRCQGRYPRPQPLPGYNCTSITSDCSIYSWFWLAWAYEKCMWGWLFTIQTAAAINISNQNISLPRASYCALPGSCWIIPAWWSKRAKLKIIGLKVSLAFKFWLWH